MPKTPTYTRIIEDIKAQIAAGTLKPGDQLPTVAALMRQYETSSTAVRNAMLLLRAEGLVIGHQGKGVFVADAGQPT